MIGYTGNEDPGLRERKKLRTRTQLIEAALELADRQGYESTTVEQITDAVDVSPRTFARYFPTKDSAILSLLDHLSAAVNDELALVDPEVPPFQSLLIANVGMLRRAIRGSGPMTITRIATLLRVVNTSPTLQSLSIALRSQETAVAMARRLNTTTDDHTVRLISSVWGAIIAHAWGALGTESAEFELTADNIPERMHGLLVEAFADFAEIARSPVAGPTQSAPALPVP